MPVVMLVIILLVPLAWICWKQLTGLRAMEIRTGWVLFFPGTIIRYCSGRVRPSMHVRQPADRNHRIYHRRSPALHHELNASDAKARRRVLAVRKRPSFATIALMK